MLSQRANYTTAFMIRGKKNFCPLLDASFMMLWRDMAYVKNVCKPRLKKSFKSIMYRLTFCHTRGIAIISEVTEKSNTIILCMYVLL